MLKFFHDFSEALQFQRNLYKNLHILFLVKTIDKNKLMKKLLIQRSSKVLASSKESVNRCGKLTMIKLHEEKTIQLSGICDGD